MIPAARLTALALALTALAPARAADERELLRDGDFERAGKRSSPGWTHVWPTTLAPEPEFSYPEDEPDEGERCAQVAVVFSGGYSSFKQEVDVPRRAGWVRLSGRVRLVDASGGATWLMLGFVGKDATDFQMRQTRRVTEPGGWESHVLESAIPEGTQRILVRCGVFGPARARFDAVSLVAGEGDLPRTDVTLIEAHSYWRASATEAVEDPRVDVAIPFPFAAQTPLAVRVDSEPPGAVRALTVLAERENRPLRVHLDPLDPGAEVKLHVRTLVMVRRRELPDGAKVGVKARPPEELRAYLEPQPGIESDHDSIRAAARRLSRRDLAGLVADLYAFLRAEIAAGSGDQGALATLESKDAACTGHANLGAALMVAAGVPSRVLACVLVGSVQQEHYVVESWTRELGWTRLEPTVKVFPVPDEQHVILRVVYPDSPRSAYNVPLFWRLSDGLDGGQDPAPLDEGGSWQRADQREQLVLETDAAEALEASSRAAFEALLVEPVLGGRTSLAPPDTPAEVVPALSVFLAE